MTHDPTNYADTPDTRSPDEYNTELADLAEYFRNLPGDTGYQDAKFQAAAKEIGHFISLRKHVNTYLGYTRRLEARVEVLTRENSALPQ